MKLPQFFITLILSAICLLLSIITSWQGRDQLNQQLDLQDKDRKDSAVLQGKQAAINRDGPQMQTVYQVYNAVLKDIAAAAYDTTTGSVKNAKLKDLLAKNNITVNLPPPGSQPAPAASPAPAATLRP